MAINLDLIKRKLQEVQSSNVSKTDRLWKPEAGKTQIRIVPYQFNKDWPFIELYFHYNYGKKTILSPSTYGKPDPICEFAEKLKQTGDKDDWKNGRSMEPKFRCYIPVIVRGQESEGVKFWGFGKTTYQELLSIIDDPDYGDIADLKNGRDITVEFIKPEDAGNSYGKTTIRVKPNASPATTDKDIMEKILNGQKDIKELYPEPSYDDLILVLQKWLNSANASEADTAAETDSQSNKAASTKKAASSATKSSTKEVAAAFDELFDEPK